MLAVSLVHVTAKLHMCNVLPRVTVVFLALAVGACREDSSPLTPITGAEASVAIRAAGRGSDAWFAAVGSELPVFGGLYFDGGRLHVNLTDPEQRTLAAEVIRREFSGTALGYTTGLANVDVADMAVHHVTYDFQTLLRWKHAVADVLTLPGVYFLDADERSNRVAIGLNDPTLALAVLRLTDSRGVPREAVLLKPAGPFEFRYNTHLQAPVRPQGGGPQVTYMSGTAELGCTIGFSATRLNGTDSLFVTASHCSPQMGVLDGVLYYQPNRAFVSAETGVEIEDFPWQDNTTYPECPSGKECKVADALLARYRNASSEPSFWTRGRIYRTTRQSSPGDIVLTIEPDSEYFSIVGTQNFPFIGDTLHKVGRMTGWTSGVVTDSCIDVPMSTTRILLCQDFATYMDAGGDSGAPVFKRSGSSSAVLVGIHSSYSPTIDKRVLSAYGQIEEELKLLRVTP